MNNIGKLVGNYFYFVGIALIIHLYYNWHNSVEFTKDLSFITYFGAGYFLNKHFKKSRNIISICCGVGVVIYLLSFLYVLIYGLPENLHWSFGGFQPEIKVAMQVYVWSIISIIVFSVPFLLLRSKKAKIECEDDMKSV